jgi:hypothetical protein
MIFNRRAACRYEEGNPMTAPSLLEEFVRDYVETTGGVWEEVEPQVYDVLLPSSAGSEVVRVAFDPEALPEHPGAQLASYGTPLIDRLLADAVARGRYAQLYLVGLNLTPHDLPALLRRALTLPDGSSLQTQRVRPLHFTQALFWFRATFISDQKEQEVVPVALDLHYGREVRHLDALLDHSRLTEAPALPLAEARRLSLTRAYPLARDAVLPTVAALANIRNRDTTAHVERQVARMSRYYADLRSELDEQRSRAEHRGDDLSRFTGRREALEREERLRITELRQKSALHVEVALLTVLLVQQPKLLATAAVVAKGHAPAPLELVWDPLMGTVEAAPCPFCHRPTLAWAWGRPERGNPAPLVCPTCASQPGRRRS